MTTTELPIDLNLEELTINPKTPLPSFIEVILLEKASESGQKVLKSIVDAVASNANQYIQRRRYDGDNNTWLTSVFYIKKKIALIISRLCTKYKLEVLLVLTYFIEKHILSTSSNATLSESLFGMKRSKIRGGKYLQPIKKSDSIKAALLLAMVPYVSEKAKETYERESEIERRLRNNNTNSSDNDQRETFIARFKKFFIYIFPFLHMTSEGMHIVYQFAYMLGKSVYYHPSSHILSQVVRRYTISDLQQKESIEDGKKDLAMTKLGSRSLQKSAITGVMIALLVGWIGQFRRHLRRRRRRLLTRNDLEMPYSASSRDDTSGYREGDIITIPPPLPPTPGNDLNVSSSLCPLCREKRIHPVATTGGFVFCYRCICIYIRENGEKCPVTGMSCKESQLVRIYESTNTVSHQ